ncbi:hypothetical protein BPAE_0189g00130 [Botrytis paeoniae]|uniref:Uncharacterized protein n=1 Tax=Botrytis paeoniae TaxID=278948 RepID=A0A4Z1FKC6_9HELO|nr:hypothetical protein BPAE_0189g00130 [Botrytis paeoniae]
MVLKGKTPLKVAEEGKISDGEYNSKCASAAGKSCTKPEKGICISLATPELFFGKTPSPQQKYVIPSMQHNPITTLVPVNRPTGNLNFNRIVGN